MYLLNILPLQKLKSDSGIRFSGRCEILTVVTESVIEVMTTSR